MRKQDAPINEYLLLFILAIAQFTHIVDFMIIMPLGKQLMKYYDISPQAFSLLVSAYALGSFVSGLYAASFIDRFDHKKALFFLYIGFTIGTLACAFAPDFYFLLAARLFTGAFGGVISAMVLSIVGDVIPIERRGRAMGFVMTAFSVASIAGVPLSLLIAAKFTWQAPFLVLGGLAFMTILMIWFAVPNITGHLQKETPKLSIWKSVQQILEDKNQATALLFTIVYMLGHFTIIPFLSPYLQLNIGFSDTEIGYVYLIGGSLTVISLPSFGWLSDMYGHLRVFTAVSVFALFSIFAITNLPPVSMPIALLATSSFFIVGSGRSVPSTSLVTSVVRPESRGGFMAVRSSARELGLLLGSLIAGQIIVENPDETLMNYEIVGYFTIFMSVMAIFVLRRLRIVA